MVASVFVVRGVAHVLASAPLGVGRAVWAEVVVVELPVFEEALLQVTEDGADARGRGGAVGDPRGRARVVAIVAVVDVGTVVGVGAVDEVLVGNVELLRKDVELLPGVPGVFFLRRRAVERSRTKKTSAAMTKNSVKRKITLIVKTATGVLPMLMLPVALRHIVATYLFEEGQRVRGARERVVCRSSVLSWS